MSTNSPRSDGLEGVAVADTVLSDVDGERGHLILRGYDVEDLALRCTFEQAYELFSSGSFSSTASRQVHEQIGRARLDAFEVLEASSSVGSLARYADGMEALRALAGAWISSGDTARDSIAMAGAMPVFVSAWWRSLHGEKAIRPDASLSHAQDYLRMLAGEAPSPERARALDTYLVTVSDHGMNASTFSARVVASTGSDVVSAITAALGALKGPLHGGAPGPVLDMLDEIATPDAAAPWVDAKLASGERIMGLGHRVYRVRDPRAAVLERELERLSKAGVSTGRLPLARAVEQVAVGALARRHPARALQANVEFYTAVLLDTIGLDRRLFTPTFAIGRVIGWLAHIHEQKATGRLIRPASRYVGTRADPAAA